MRYFFSRISDSCIAAAQSMLDAPLVGRMRQAGRAVARRAPKRIKYASNNVHHAVTEVVAGGASRAHSRVTLSMHDATTGRSVAMACVPSDQISRPDHDMHRQHTGTSMEEERSHGAHLRHGDAVLEMQSQEEICRARFLSPDIYIYHQSHIGISVPGDISPSSPAPSSQTAASTRAHVTYSPYS